MSIECAFFGALGRDAEQKVSKSGKPYLRLFVRVGDGDDVQSITIMCFDADAIAAADKLSRGARVYVEGKLLTSEWIGKDGEKRLGLSVMSFHCRIAQIGRNKTKAYNLPRSAPAGRLLDAKKTNDAGVKALLDDDIGF